MGIDFMEVFMLIYFLLGCLTFYITEFLIRFPFLDFINGLFPDSALFFTLLILAFSKGILDEIGRFILFMATEPKKDSLFPPVFAGLGFGLTEAILVNKGISIGLPTYPGFSGVMVRVFIMFFHIALSVYYYDQNRKGVVFKTLIFGILLHSLLLLILLLLVNFMNITVSLVILAITGGLSLVYTGFKLRSESEKIL